LKGKTALWLSSPAGQTKMSAKKVSRARKSGPTARDLVLQAVATSMERKGLSSAALMRILAAQGYDVDRNKARVKTAITSLVKKGALVRTTGAGASACFRMTSKPMVAQRKRPAAKRRAGKKSRRRPKKAKGRKAKRRAGKKPRRRPKKAKGRKAKKTSKRRRKAPKRRRRVVRKASGTKRASAKKAARRRRRRAK
uniref:H15 domain-containing protein n=1 Tax=Takifugu rubripes TaxID=31033 RepID=A0A674MI04_TAKRU